MTGKIKSFNYNFLISIISVVHFINSFYFKNFYIFGLYSSSLIAAIFFTKYGLYFLKKYNLFQIIRKEGPSSHSTKDKTPTMGGIFIIPIFLTLILIFNISYLPLKLTLFSLILSFFLIGFFDDYLSIRNKTNLGLKGNEKLFLQIISTSCFIFLLFDISLINPNINFFNDIVINFEDLVIPISIITIVGLSNAVNLTDGLDGLAAGCSSIVFCGLGTEILISSNENFILYGLLSFSMSGLCLGFLKYNKFPAKIFMGDTGSLTIGAIIGILCVLTNSFFTVFVMSGIFIIETLSVLIQVSYFKITKKFLKKGKKLFLMTPIHHHFELKGFKEKQIVEIFWIINIILVIVSIVLK